MSATPNRTAPESTFRASILRRLRHNVSKTSLRNPVILLRHFGIAPADVFVSSYPRSGSTWLRFLLYEILTGQTADFRVVNQVFPGVGNHRFAPRLLSGGGRLIHSHEPYRREYRKAVYLVRDIRDVVLSAYAREKATGLVRWEFRDYLIPFLRGRTNGFGSWQQHVRSWLDADIKTTGDLLVITFEDMRSDPQRVLVSVVKFLGADANLPVIQAAINNNSIERMRIKEDNSQDSLKSRTEDGRFVRKGSVEGWRKKLNDAQLRAISRYAGEELLRMGYAPTSEPSDLSQAPNRERPLQTQP